MPCSSFGVSQILVGLHRVGMVGLSEALRSVDTADPGRREEILDQLVDQLRAENFIPASELEPYRRAIWRELLRLHGQDLSDWFSEVEVMVHAEPGDDRDRLEQLLRAVLAELELAPVFTRPLLSKDIDEGVVSGTEEDDDGNDDHDDDAARARPVVDLGGVRIVVDQLEHARLLSQVRATLSDW